MKGVLNGVASLGKAQCSDWKWTLQSSKPMKKIKVCKVEKRMLTAVGTEKKSAHNNFITKYQEAESQESVGLVENKLQDNSNCTTTKDQEWQLTSPSLIKGYLVRLQLAANRAGHRNCHPQRLFLQSLPSDDDALTEED